MANQTSSLSDLELNAVSGGFTDTATAGTAGLDNPAPETTLGRVRTSDKQAKAVLAFIKG